MPAMTPTGTSVKPSQTITATTERDRDDGAGSPTASRSRACAPSSSAVIEVQAERDHRDDVEQRDPPDAEARDDVAVDVAMPCESVMPRQPPGSIVSVVKCRMWTTMKTRSSTPPHFIVRDASVDDLRLAAR